MKKIRYYKSAIILIFALVGCNEIELLREEPLDFYSPGNVYRTAEQFNFAVTDLYNRIAEVTYASNDNTGAMIGGYADNLYHIYGEGAVAHHNRILPEAAVPSYFWERYYKIISNPL